jgi:hypothetical protein
MPKFCIEWDQEAYGENILEADNKDEALDNFYKIDRDEVLEDLRFGDFVVINIYEVDDE